MGGARLSCPPPTAKENPTRVLDIQQADRSFGHSPPGHPGPHGRLVDAGVGHRRHQCGRIGKPILIFFSFRDVGADASNARYYSILIENREFGREISVNFANNVKFFFFFFAGLTRFKDPFVVGLEGNIFILGEQVC